MRDTVLARNSLFGTAYWFWGSILLLFSMALSLGAYYSYLPWMREIAFVMLVFGLGLFFLALYVDIDASIGTSMISIVLTFGMLLLYFLLRTQLHRFDFGVGDASDYFIAGVCSVTYSQDIGFFLPLTASISALGYSIFGVEYAPFIDVLLYAATVPLSYALFRMFGLSVWISVLMTLFLIINPLSIWFSKTSFSEPIWQLLLILFTLFFTHIMSKAKLRLLEVIGYFLILALIPFLRGEGVLYYGLVVFLALYHLWKYSHFRSAMILILGLLILAVSIHFTLDIREHYLLGWQFSRVIPDITRKQLMIILYSIAGVMMGLLILLNSVKRWFSNIPFTAIVTLLVILFKVAIAYVYMQKKSLPFMDLLIYREYGLALGNFGLPLTILIGIGVLLLHYNAIKGKKMALLFVVMYAIFYLPFVMQGVTFHDPHELFLYWNRYYFSVLMMVHLFSLALVVQLIYKQSKRLLGSTRRSVLFVSITMTILSLFSLNLKVLEITVKEAYLENSYKVFTWLKKRVKNQPISVLYDDGIRYERHNGLYDAKVFTARMFTVLKINAKMWQKVKRKELKSRIILNKGMSKASYLVYITSQKPQLPNKSLIVIDQTIFPISWRENYRAQPRPKEEKLADVSQSLKNELTLYLTLCKIPKEVR